MTQATHMCVHQRRHGACMGSLVVLSGRLAHTGGVVVRRYMYDTQVTGDVSGWATMSRAQDMSVYTYAAAIVPMGGILHICVLAG